MTPPPIRRQGQSGSCISSRSASLSPRAARIKNAAHTVQFTSAIISFGISEAIAPRGRRPQPPGGGARQLLAKPSADARQCSVERPHDPSGKAAAQGGAEPPTRGNQDHHPRSDKVVRYPVPSHEPGNRKWAEDNRGYQPRTPTPVAPKED